ncbi:hypothetical protein M1P56_04430 [Streptomyces sp. HU2014]|uniref:DUF559 domain-containing protein n=1 Tax=Streptomyces albireticuli TaxID=1940 RepID=A0A1Z2L734_9ACTN|nr:MULTISPECIES: hypothetical protein [Streptomyces]ARZ70095.1 hypothetical protein SMD11_4494 [Streptomyces albireticuli]UQI43661.1 hypothetical protein M1P56_04430 [Streptomyces sp. HU2014]
MNPDTPLSPRPLHHLSDVRTRVLTSRQLREHGVPGAAVTERCRPGGPWQQLLPGVFLLRTGPATSEERLHAALLYTVPRTQGPPAQAGPGTATAAARAAAGDPYGEAMITGPAALALHRFTSVPPLLSLDRIDVLVPRTRRLRTTGFVRLVRAPALPQARRLTGVPVAPVPRAVADTVALLTEAAAVRRVLTEAVRGGHCEAAAVVRELTRARLLGRAHVTEAVDALLTESRAVAEGRLYDLVREHRLPAPLWNVDLRLPGGPHLGRVDAFWPEHSVALEIDSRAPQEDDETLWSEQYRKREHLERLGITVVHVTPRKLRDTPEQQAAVVRTALMASADRDPAAYLVVLPR